MKRIGGFSILIMMISVLLPYHSTADAAERQLVNGGYQVELSFQSDGAADQEVLFGNKAELTVKEGRYSLSVPVKYQDVIKKITVKQSGSQLKSSLNADENLVQFDIKNIQEKLILEGTFQWSADDIPVTFSQELVINKNSLPKEEQQPAAEEQNSIGSAGQTDGKTEPPARSESESSNKAPIIKKTERWSYTPRPSRHSKEAAEAREKEQAAEAARKAAYEEEQLVFDRTQDEPAKEQPVKEKIPVEPVVVQVAGEEAEVTPAPSKIAEGPAISFDVAKVGVLFLACILSGVLLIRRLVNRKKQVINE